MKHKHKIGWQNKDPKNTNLNKCKNVKLADENTYTNRWKSINVYTSYNITEHFIR